VTVWTTAALPVAWMHWETVLALLPGLVIGLTLHEFAHAASASLLGDDYARRQGRISLNPFRHLSLLGTLAILVFPFGWARPVPVNVYNFRRPKRDYLLTSLAGPAANLVVVAAALGLMYLTRYSFIFGLRGVSWMGTVHLVLLMVALINMVLAVLNLLPIPPLDGSKIWPLVLGRRLIHPGQKTGWLAIILLVVLLQFGVLDGLFNRTLAAITAMAPASDLQIVNDKADQADEAFGRGDMPAAERLYDEILSISGPVPRFLYERACCRLARGHWKAALADCETVLAMPPDTPGRSRVAAEVKALRDRLAQKVTTRQTTSRSSP
jgi:Zn-dependent protease